MQVAGAPFLEINNIYIFFLLLTMIRNGMSLNPS